MLGHLASRAMNPGDSHWAHLQTTDAIAGASVLVSLALFSYTRKRDRDPRFILDLGLAYMVLTALALSLMFHWEPVPNGRPVTPVIT